ncbi:HvfB family MNIO-type RiPP peptide maturase [Congregibacter sp.]|uniref:HvfB family MNIO-type RiPP peptide maturase n=1 Tax=Congregibacter sp. TaxID=2744308 RepID=UPI003F6AC0C4
MSDTPSKDPLGAGLGLRRALMGPLLSMQEGAVDFLELAPENWIGVGGRFSDGLSTLGERFPFVMHGLSLDIGGPDPLDMNLLEGVADLIRRFDVPIYSEHLTYCAADGHLYDLLPIPFTDEAVRYVSQRIQVVQDFLGMPLVLENASYYAQAHRELDEATFINAIVEESGCELLLDVNNVYVNSINHRYEPVAFMEALPLHAVRYLHIAGHYDEAEDLKVDTHGTDVIDPVWALLDEAYARVGALPTLLERDFNFPALDTLLSEIEQIRSAQQRRDLPAQKVSL